MIFVREESDADHDAVRRLTIEAFTPGEYGHNGEAALVDRLRASGAPVLSLVAIDDGEVVGHILFSPVTIHSTREVAQGMGLAPMAVAPARQKRGVGSALINAGHERLRAEGCPWVVVFGHADYYPRFGFEPASRYELTHGFEGLPQDLLFMRLLDTEALLPAGPSRAIYRPEFGEQLGLA